MARSLLDRIGLDSDSFIFVFIIGAMVFPVLILPFVVIAESENEAKVKIAEAEAVAAQAKVIQWIGMDAVQSIDADSLVLTEDESKGVHMLVVVDNGNVTQYYVNQSEVSHVQSYIDEKEN